MNLPTTNLSIAEIASDDWLQPRCDGLSDEHVAALMETPEDWPPIMVAHFEGAAHVVDGFHRLEAARRLGYESIAAKVFYPDQNTDLFRIAFSLNVQHGRPLTRRDRNAYAAALLQQHPDLSDREIGRRSGLHHETIGSIRNRRRDVASADRKAGALPRDVGLFDPVRRARATKDHKAIAGYVSRLAIALGDPYEEQSSLGVWPDEPAEIAQACIDAMGAQRAAGTLSSIAADARFMVRVAKAVRELIEEAS
jgi:ParB-like chromosome segregation protein Spo0J